MDDQVKRIKTLAEVQAEAAAPVAPVEDKGTDHGVADEGVTLIKGCLHYPGVTQAPYGDDEPTTAPKLRLF